MAKVLEESLYQTDYYAWTRQQAAELRRLAADPRLDAVRVTIENLTGRGGAGPRQLSTHVRLFRL